MVLKDYLSGLRLGDSEAHRAGYSPSRFDRCPCQSIPGTVVSASAQADDDSRWRDSAGESAMAGTVVGGTVAGGTVVEDTVAGMGIETPGIVAATVIECTAAARMGETLFRREDTGSDNNPDHSHACASIPALGLVSVSCSCLMLTDPVASPREPPYHWASIVGTA